jgi:serine/threonine protein kinase
MVVSKIAGSGGTVWSIRHRIGGSPTLTTALEASCVSPVQQRKKNDNGNKNRALNSSSGSGSIGQSQLQAASLVRTSPRCSPTGARLHHTNHKNNPYTNNSSSNAAVTPSSPSLAAAAVAVVVHGGKSRGGSGKPWSIGRRTLCWCGIVSLVCCGLSMVVVQLQPKVDYYYYYGQSNNYDEPKTSTKGTATTARHRPEPVSPLSVVANSAGATGTYLRQQQQQQQQRPQSSLPINDSENAAAAATTITAVLRPASTTSIDTTSRADDPAARVVVPSLLDKKKKMEKDDPTIMTTLPPKAVAGSAAVSWPRIVYLQHENDVNVHHQYPLMDRQHQQEGPTTTIRTMELESSKTTMDGGDRSSSVNEPDHDDAWHSPHDDRCRPKADWQVASNPNCNAIHEIDLHDHQRRLSVLGEGWFRTTWRYDNNDDGQNHPSVVLKTLRIAREFISEYYELHRRDAVAMERLTASPFVVNIYAYCGQSAVNELADFPYGNVQNLEGFNRRMRGNDSFKANVIRLRMAASIALGLADIHAGGSSSGGDTRATADDGEVNGDADEENAMAQPAPPVYMAHYDLNPRNIALFAGGKPKINDFNIAEFIHYDNVTMQDCKFPSRLHEPWWRAPEEMNTTHTILVNEKVDVYALGNILYHTLTTHSSRGAQTKDRMNQVRPIVAAGIRPNISSHYRSSKDPNVLAMVHAIDLCWEKDPNQRASAADVAAVLYEALVKMTQPSSPSSSSSNAALPTDVADVAATAGIDNDNSNNNATTAVNDNDGEPDDEMPASAEDKGALAHWDSTTTTTPSSATAAEAATSP